MGKLTESIVLVQCCDKNSWIWPYWWEYFRRCWNWGCGIDVVMLCENKKPEDIPVFSPAYRGDWTDRQIQFFKDYPEVKNFLYCVEDQLLMEKVDIVELKRLLSIVGKSKPFVILNNDKYINSQINNPKTADGLIPINKNHPIQLWLQASIIDARFYTRLLKPGMTPWEFETKNQNVVRALPTYSYIYGGNKPVFRYREVLRRGLLKPHRMKYLWAVDALNVFPEGDRELDKFKTEHYYNKWKSKIKPNTVLMDWVK